MDALESYIPWLQIAIGALLLCCGWALYRVGMMLFSLFLGSIGGGYLARLAIRLMPDVPDVWWVVVLGAVLGGVVGVLLIRRLYFVALLIISGLFALNLKQTFLSDVPIFRLMDLPAVETFWNSPAGTVVFALVFALLVVALHRFIVIWLTSGVGAMLIAERLPWQEAVYFLALAGVIAQLGLIRGFGIDMGKETNRWKQERAMDDDQQQRQ